MTRKVAAIATILLLAALGPWPYDFYLLLRVLIFGAGIYCGFAMLEKERRLAVALFICAALFNPFVPAHLTREIWSILNIAGAVVFGLSFRRLRAV